jgi:hypothetical protein
VAIVFEEATEQLTKEESQVKGFLEFTFRQSGHFSFVSSLTMDNN